MTPCDERLHVALAGVSEQLEAARLRAEALVQRCQTTCEASVRVCSASRAHLTYARLDGVVAGERASAVVRMTGEVRGDARWLARARIVEGIGDVFAHGRIAASLSGSCIASTLTLIRSADFVEQVQLNVRNHSKRTRRA